MSTSQDALWVDDLYALHSEVERVHWWFNGRRRIVKSVADRILAGVTDPLVVDVGCGTGANVAALAESYRAVGIDPSGHAVDIARKLFPKLQFIAGHAPEDLGELASQADLFLLMDVMEHVRDDFDLLSGILAAARPGAQVLITVPADERLWSQHDITLGHFRRYTEERLAAVWKGLPVEVRLLSHFNARLYPLIRGARAAASLFGRSLGGQGTDQGVPPGPVNRLLFRTFAGEEKRLLSRVDTGLPAYPRGVSLLAALRRGGGAIQRRVRPVQLDDHNIVGPTSKPSSS